MKLYQRIKQRRIELNLSQDELAQRLGYKSRSSINKIEKGENDIPQSKIIKFANALNTTPEYLMGWEEEPLPPVPQEQTENLLLTMFAGQPDILDFLHEHNFSMQGDISVIGDEEITLVKHAILSSIVKAQRHAKKHHITDNTKSGKATIIIKKEDKKQ